MKKNPKVLNLLKTVLYYFIAAGCVWAIHLYDMNRGHFPFELGKIVAFLFVPILSTLLIIWNLYLVSKNKNEHVFSLLAHVLATLIYLIFGWFG